MVLIVVFTVTAFGCGPSAKQREPEAAKNEIGRADAGVAAEVKVVLMVDGGDVDAGEPDIGGAGEEQPVVTIKDLRKHPGKPRTVRLRAYYTGYQTPGACRGAEGCDQGAGRTLVSENRYDSEYESLILEGHPPEIEWLERWREYTFVVELGQGYQESLERKRGAPYKINMRLIDCVDCPRLRKATVDELVEQPELAGVVEVEAYLFSSNKPFKCPKRHRCQPSAHTTVLTGDPDDPAANRICAHGLVPKARKLIKKGRPFRFILRIEEGYRSTIGPNGHCGDPRWHPIKLHSCLDCR